MRKRQISPAERRHQDYLRRRGLKVGYVYESRLLRARAHEVKRVLTLCAKTSDNAIYWPALIDTNLDETGYLPKWWDGLYQDTGLPMCKSTVRDLNQAKAANEDSLWLGKLREYAANRAGSEIVVVSGTLRETLINVLRDEMAAEPGLGIEKLTKRIYDKYQELAKWQVRRIAQTESMIAMADAADIAAESLDIGYTKQWCISGLGNTRDTHEIMDGVEVDQHQPFLLQGGQMMYPHDCSMGAAAAEIINCACSCIRRPKKDSAHAPAPMEDPYEPALSPEEQRIQSLMQEMDPSLPETTRRAIAQNDIALEEAFGITKGSPMSVDLADMQHANPNFVQKFIPDSNGAYRNKLGERFSLNPEWKASSKAYSINCQTCAPDYMLRLRGFDITAKGNTKGSTLEYLSKGGHAWEVWLNPDGTPATHTSQLKWMMDKGYSKMSPGRYKEFFEEVCKEEGVYELSIGWTRADGHATILQRFSDGTLKYIEPQHDNSSDRSITYLCDNGHKGLPHICRGIMRIDNKIFNVKYAGIFNVIKKAKK